MDEQKVASELIKIAKGLVAKKPSVALSAAHDALNKAESELNSVMGTKDILSAADMKKIVNFHKQIKAMARESNQIKQRILK